MRYYCKMQGHDGECNCDNCEAIHVCLNENQKKQREVDLMFGEQEPASQLLASSDDEVPEQDDGVIDLVTPPRVKKAPRKRPMGARRFLDLEADEVDDDVPPSDDDDGEGLNVVYMSQPLIDATDLHVPLRPNLEKYFRQFKDITNFTKISLCRTYANYLAQVEKSKNESKSKRNKF